MKYKIVKITDKNYHLSNDMIFAELMVKREPMLKR